MRIGFVGELGYELHFPSPAGEHLWDALVAEGAQPFGLEPQRVLRLEKGHVIVGQDTDSESNLYSAGMSWLPKLDKDDFVGKFALEHFAQREEKEKLVGFTMEEDVLPRGCRSSSRASAGRVTSAPGASGRQGHRLARGFPRIGPKSGTRSRSASIGCCARACHTRAFFDTAGERMRVVSRAFLSPRAASPRRGRRRCGARSKTSIRQQFATPLSRVWRSGGDSTWCGGLRGEGARTALPRRLPLHRRRPADVAERLRAAACLAYDATGALAGMIASEQVCAGSPRSRPRGAYRGPVSPRDGDLSARG
jgi:hypothetical protein